MFALYRKGDTHCVDGIQCEIARVAMGDLEEYRANGWVDDIQDINKPEEKESAVKAQKPKK
jgi:hypothetical protein